MKVVVQDLATEYQDEGSGATALFLHGWQDNLHTFDALAPSLSGDMRIIRLDLPGFGKTEDPKEAWGLDDYVQFVKSFIEKLDVRVDVLIGHSFGGRVAIKGVSTRKIQPKKLILIGAAGVGQKNPLKNASLKIMAKIVKAALYIPPFLFWRKQIRKKIYRAIGSDYADAGTLKDTFVNIISEDLTENAGRVACPTLLIWGADDAATPLAGGKQLAEKIHNSQLKIVRGSGHFVHREKPNEVARYIRKFI